MSEENLPEKPDAVFEIVFEGKTVLPEKIPFNALARTLSAIQSLATGEESLNDEDDEEEGTLRLLGMRRGSAIFEIYAPSPGLALAHLRETGSVIDRIQPVDDFDHLLSPLESLSGMARRMDCAIILKEAGDEGVVLAKIAGSTYQELSENLYVVGHTSLLTTVERVGGVGKKPRCVLRVPGRSRLLFCDVIRREDARTMGHQLYKSVIVHGKATWLKSNWRLVTFIVEDVSLLKEAKLSDAIEALREAGGKGWDEIADPQALMDEIRGDR